MQDALENCKGPTQEDGIPYHQGHIFIINDKLVTDYKAGDVYEYVHEQDTHGAANIGHIPRLVLQVTEYL